MATSEIISPNQHHEDSPAFVGHHIVSSGDAIDESAFLAQVDRIMKSDELRGSDVLRRLLKFLAQKSVSGTTDELKEYSIAIEALNKPTSYDPRHSSAVRILVGRLRQKLTNYYQRQGRYDPILIDLPKGHFKLTCELRNRPQERATQSSVLETPAHLPAFHRSERSSGAIRAAAWVAFGIIVAISGEAIIRHAQVAKAGVSSTSSPASLDPSVAELWNPFYATDRPVIVAVGGPLFAVLNVKKGIYYREKNFDNWDQVISSPEVKAIRTLVGSDGIEPIRYYTAFGEAQASFMIAKLLGSRVENLSVVRTTDLSMQEMADNNIVFVGNQDKYFKQQIHASPIEPLLQPVSEGIRNLHPESNEPELFVDNYSEAPTEEGYAYALVTHLPGPLGGNDVESFTSNRAAGYVAAVKAFSEPGFVRHLVEKLKQTGKGQMPRYYQILLQVRFKTEVPTEISYVLSRELHYTKKQ